MQDHTRGLSKSWIINSSKFAMEETKIGTGNFADVYRGMLCIDDKEVCVAAKVVRVGGGNMCDDEHGNCLVELKNEAIVLASLQHPTIIKFYGISIDRIPMILVEFCAGGSLETHLQSFKEKIYCAERIQYSCEISEGMRYLESKNCIHCDLATRNVLISTTGTLKISDFGLSRISEAACQITDASNAHIPIRWMAPETINRNPLYSSKSDVWSFGIVIFEIFNCGQKPWPEKPVKWIATKIRHGITAELPKRTPRLMREIAAVCTTFQTENRPTFQQLNCRIKFVQAIRFSKLPSQSLTLSQLKNVQLVPLESQEMPGLVKVEFPDSEAIVR